MNITYHQYNLLSVLNVQEVPDEFHCRFKAYERRYLYRVAVPKSSTPFRERLTIPAPITENSQCHFLQHPTFDAEAINAATSIFVGVKDFASVQSVNKGSHQRTTIREIRSVQLVPGAPLIHHPKLLEEYDFWNFVVIGKSFLYHQVRRMVSLLIDHGKGRISLSQLQEIMDQPGKKSEALTSKVLPPNGLFLTDILYKPEDLVVEFTPEERELQRLLAEESEINKTIADFKGSVLKKISLHSKLVEIKKAINRLGN